MNSFLSKIKNNVKSTNSDHQPPLEKNPIMDYFKIGKRIGSAGPELAWTVYEARRKNDDLDCAVYIFDKRYTEKLFKPKRKEAVLDRLRASVAHLNRIRHAKMLKILHPIEEGQNTIAFASEPIIGCLHDILSWQENPPNASAKAPPVTPMPASLDPADEQPPPDTSPRSPPPGVKPYSFLDFEVRYGLTQIIDALRYFHHTARQIHRNVCPQVIIVTKSGAWKLFGLEFVESLVGTDALAFIPAAPWSVKVSKLMQPSLDYLAPEVQWSGHCNILSDMFSLGLVICAIFNNGKGLLQANNSPVLYIKQLECLEQQVDALLPRVPPALQEAVQRLLSREANARPTTQLLPLIKYFKCRDECGIQALQNLDAIGMKDNAYKNKFYSESLIDALPYIPEKLRWQHVWPALLLELNTGMVVAAVLQSVMWFVSNSSQEEFRKDVLPLLLDVMKTPWSVQASVILLDNMHLILCKCSKNEIDKEVLPQFYLKLDSRNFQIQIASLIALQKVSDYIGDGPLRALVLPKVQLMLENNNTDVKIVHQVIGVYETIMHRSVLHNIPDEIIHSLLGARLSNPEIINRVIKLYKYMMLEKKVLTVDAMATKLIPSLAPQSVNEAITYQQFIDLIEMLYLMLQKIHQQQSVKLKEEAIMSNERRRSQIHMDNMNAPPFQIPNLRVEQRKTSSAEEMARKNSASGPSGVSTGSVSGFKNSGFGQWLFGLSNTSNADNNLLRVANVLPNRRLSDNTLMTPKIRIAPSCASSPGGNPGTAGLPARRHSSIGPQERRGSGVTLSPPTANQTRGRGGSGSSLSVPSTSQYIANQTRGRGDSGSNLSVPSTSQCIVGSMSNASYSVPYLMTSSTNSVRSRRPSMSTTTQPTGSGLLQHLSTGMVRHLPTGPANSRQRYTRPHWSLHGATAAGYNALHHTAAMAVSKCPSLSISLTR